jgi:outer membrane beta-barrel protein
MSWMMRGAGFIAGLAVLGAGMSVAQAETPAKSNNEYEGPLKEQLQEYWSVDRELPGVTNRLHTREGTVSLGLYSGLMTSEPFYWYIPVGLRVSYYLSDSFGLEMGGQFSLAQNTELTDALETLRGDSFDVKLDGQDKYIWRANLVATWHPLYGKLALLQRKLSHFDLKLQGGLGAVGLDRPNKTRTAVESSVGLDVVLGAGASFFLTEGITLRLDGRGYVGLGPEFDTSSTLKDRGFVGRLNFPIEFLLGVDYAF